MESVEQQQQHQAAARLSGSPPHPVDVSPPLSPSSAAAAALANARWTPTKEQIGVLEGLYRQGMRTPTAEQIQQVTASLQRHGPIEGKNVFYWFQNHKARQRQRQKQQAFDYFARHFRRPQPLPVLHRPAAHPFLPPIPLHAPPPPPHMSSSSCNRQAQAMYMQQQQQQPPPCNMTAAVAANASYYLQTQTPMVYPNPRVAHEKVPAQAPAAMNYQAVAPNNAGTQQPRALHSPPATSSSRRHPETLNLFPLHPTFALPKKTRRAESAGSSMTMAPSSSASFSLEPESTSGNASPPLYDFFGVGR